MALEQTGIGSFTQLLQEAIVESGGGTQQQEVTQEAPPAPAPSAPEPEAQVEAPKAESAAEPRYIEVKDDDGTTRRIKINPAKSVEELWKDVYNYQKGMRKFQAAHDKLVKAGSGEAAAKWEEVSSTFKKDGVQGLINLLSGEQDGYSKFIKGIEEKAVRRATASEDELAEMSRSERLEAAENARLAAEREKNEFIERANMKEYEAKRAQVQTRLETAFEKYNMDGKLGDPGRESKLNTLIWKETIEGLEGYAKEKGISEDKIPPQVVHQMFKDNADFFGGTIAQAAERQVGGLVEKKKDDAMRSAQAMSTTQAPSRETVEEMAEKHMKGYDINGFFKQMFGGFK